MSTCPIPYFNPRSREGSDAPLRLNASFIRIFQSTLPRRERLHFELDDNTFLSISIHAPAKGATIATQTFQRTGLISIHAPAKGATTKRAFFDKDLIISIHAPAKGATPRTPQTKTSRKISIHAPAKGATRGEIETA